MKMKVLIAIASDINKYVKYTNGTDAKRISPLKRLPASIATSKKYGKALLDTRSVPSRSAATV
jgi:hypothetical protein